MGHTETAHRQVWGMTTPRAVEEFKPSGKDAPCDWCEPVGERRPAVDGLTVYRAGAEAYHGNACREHSLRIGRDGIRQGFTVVYDAGRVSVNPPKRKSLKATLEDDPLQAVHLSDRDLRTAIRKGYVRVGIPH